MRNGGILGWPRAYDPDVAIRIDSLDAIDAVPWDNSVAVHPAIMAIGGHGEQSEPKTSSGLGNARLLSCCGMLSACARRRAKDIREREVC